MALCFGIDNRMLLIYVSIGCLAFLSCSTKSAKADLIHDVCSGTTIDPQYCEKALRSDPRGPKADLTTLAQIAIALAESDTNSAINLLTSLEKKTADPKLRKIYDSCLENYKDTEDTLKTCESDLKAKDYATLSSRAAAALGGPDTCNDNFSNPPPTEPEELTQAGKKVEELCSAICVIANKLQGKT